MCESASSAVNRAARKPVVVGVPHTVRGAVPGQPSASVPVASNFSPASRAAS